MSTRATYARFERAAIALLAAITLLALSQVRLGGNPIDNLPALLWFTATVAAGPMLRLRLPGDLDLSPIGSAVALGIALTPTSLRVVLDAPGWATTAIVTVVGLTVGQLIRWRWSGESAQATPILATLVGALSAAVVYRDIPFFAGRSAMDLWGEWADHRWRSAVMMLLAAAVGSIIEGIVTIAGIRLDPSRSTSYRAVLIAIAPLSFAIVCTATMIGVGMAPLGLVAVPVMAAPLVLVRVALEQQRSARAQRRSTIASLGRFTDIAGLTTQDHAARVRQLCERVARDMHTRDDRIEALGEAALLHDLGQVALRIPIPAGATVEAAPVDQHDIAALGSQITAVGDSSEEVVSVVEHQAVPYRQVREFGEDVPLASRILKVCNAYDDFTGGRPEARPAAVERLSLGLGYEFDPEVVEVLLRVTGDDLMRVDAGEPRRFD